MGSFRRILHIGYERAPVVALAAILAVMAGCGSEADSVDLRETRACLASGGYRAIQSADYVSALPGSAAPNLAMTSDGQTVEITLEKDQRRAQGRAADLRGALRSFGSPEPARRVVRMKNSVVVFTPSPSRARRAATLECLSGS